MTRADVVRASQPRQWELTVGFALTPQRGDGRVATKLRVPRHSTVVASPGWSCADHGWSGVQCHTRADAGVIEDLHLTVQTRSKHAFRATGWVVHRAGGQSLGPVHYAVRSK